MEFWFSHLYTHDGETRSFCFFRVIWSVFECAILESLPFCNTALFFHTDIIAAHYNLWGFLPLSQGVCHPLFEELLLLLQPLSLLPFDLDLLFEPHLLQNCQEQRRRKEQLCSAGQKSDRSARSTFQLMRGWSTTASEIVRDPSSEVKKERAGLRREGTWPRMEGVGSRGGGAVVNAVKPVGRETLMEAGISHLWKERGMSAQRVKGVGQESQGDGGDGQKKESDVAREGRQRQEKQAGWWYQLMQSSQVYIDQSTDGAKFVRNEKRKKSLERRHSQLPPTREGVVDGAESSQKEERCRSSSSSSSAESAGSRVRLSWMGSPPESIIHQEKESKPLKVSDTGNQAPAQEQNRSKGQSLRWGRLFGAVGGSPSRVDGAEEKTKCPSAR